MDIKTKNAGNQLAGDFVRIAKSIGQTTNTAEATLLAERTGASDRVIESLRTRAASTAATLADPEWAGAIADDDGAAVGFIGSLRPQSIFYRIAPRANVYPLNTRVVAAAALNVGATAESEWLPVVQGSFEPVILATRRAGGIVVATDTLVNATDPASFAILRRELQAAAVAAVDTAFLGIALDGVTATAAPDLMVGIAGLLDDVALTGGEDLIFVAGVKMANALSTATDTAGARLFPTMGPSGGKLLGIDVMVSDRIDAETLALIDASGFNVNEGSIDVALGRHANLQMRTDPASEASELVSMFQTNSIALRVVAAFGADRVRDEAVAAIKLGA